MQDRADTESGRTIRASVIGLGKLGSPLAAVLASKGFEVVGMDSNPKFVAALQAGRAAVSEPGLQDLLAGARIPVRATADIDVAVANSDVTFVVVPTPSSPDGTFSNSHVISAVRDIGTALRRKDGYHLVVIASTVIPGSTDGPIRDALEAAFGRCMGERVGLCYSPEFIALGSVIRDMLNPDFVLIGESDARAGSMLESIYRTICDNQPLIRRMNFINAELTKIALNSFVTAKISFSNMLSEICDRLPGADAAVVASTVGQDSRVGSKYLNPALGFGGPCFPRDNAALASFARRLGTQADIPEATDSINDRQIGRMTDLVRSIMARGTVGILGMSYKPNTTVIEASPGVAMASSLADAGYHVLISDPEALGAAAAVLGSKVVPVPTAEECAASADLLIIATPWTCYRELPLQALRRPGRRLPVIDCWRLLPPTDFAEIVELVYLGRHRQPQPQADSAATVGHR
jgi:UDPglucose 6-dehydrogenase